MRATTLQAKKGGCQYFRKAKKRKALGQKQFITPVTEFRSSSFPPPIHPLHILLVRVEYWCVQKIFTKLSTFTFCLHHVNETCANAKVFQDDFVASIYLQKVRCDPNAAFFFQGRFSVKMTNVISFFWVLCCRCSHKTSANISKTSK